METYRPGTETLSWGPSVGLGLLAPEIPLQNFYSRYIDMGLARYTSPPLLSIWKDMVSLIA